MENQTNNVMKTANSYKEQLICILTNIYNSSVTFLESNWDDKFLFLIIPIVLLFCSIFYVFARSLKSKDYNWQKTPFFTIFTFLFIILCSFLFYKIFKENVKKLFTIFTVLEIAFFPAVKFLIFKKIPLRIEKRDLIVYFIFSAMLILIFGCCIKTLDALNSIELSDHVTKLQSALNLQRKRSIVFFSLSMAYSIYLEYQMLMNPASTTFRLYILFILLQSISIFYAFLMLSNISSLFLFEHLFYIFRHNFNFRNDASYKMLVEVINAKIALLGGKSELIK